MQKMHDLTSHVTIILWWTTEAAPARRRACHQRRNQPQDHGSLSLRSGGFELRGGSRQERGNFVKGNGGRCYC